MYYIVKTMGVKMPTWLLFLRYNLFYVLYPTGITGEILVIVNALRFVKESQRLELRFQLLWTHHLLAHPVRSLYYMSICRSLLVGPYMIRNMMKQRQKYVGVLHVHST